MPKKPKWFQKGQEGKKRAAQTDAASQKRREQSGKPFRFFQKKNESCKITFLDTPDFYFSEHHLKLNNQWGNFFTCLNDFDTCPICESGENPSYILVGTIISHKEWTDKDGNTRKNQKMLFVAKAKARENLQRQIERRKSLVGCVYEIARGGASNECATGEDFEFLKKLSKAQLKKLVPPNQEEDEFLKPYDYAKLFEPQSADALRKLVGIDAPIGADDEVETEEEEQETPEVEEEEEEETWEDKLGPMNRNQLKKVIRDEELEVKVFKGQDDDTVRSNILEALVEKYGEAEEEEEVEEEGVDAEEEEVEEEEAESNEIDSIDDLL